VAGTREIKFWIMQWGAQAAVLAPASLRREIADEAADMLHTYGPDKRT
jgi:predicted DNA-binding transcriptional regulator YafY